MHPAQLSEAWTVDGIFTSPESAVYDSARNLIYVSNVSGYARNGEGYLSALDIDGNVIEPRWLEGLNAPTGMAINGDRLFVADFDRVAEIDIPTRTIKQFYNSPDAEPGVNDITISPQNEIFVSASAVNSIYKLTNSGLERWLTSDTLEYANGVYADGETLWVAAYHLRRIDVETKKVSAAIEVDALEDLESVEADGEGGLFVTMIGARPIMWLDQEGSAAVLLEREVFTADVEYIAGRNLLIAPSGEDRVTAFSIER